MNTIYENTVLEAKLTELLNSKLEVRSLMTVDDSLTESAGLTKVINRYTYNGTVEALDGGENGTTGPGNYRAAQSGALGSGGGALTKYDNYVSDTGAGGDGVVIIYGIPV